MAQGTYGREDDARRIMAVLPQRLARFGLTMHPTKTVLVSCRMLAAQAEADTGYGTFEWLSSPYGWAKSRWGYWVRKRKIASNTYAGRCERGGGGVATSGIHH